jgi:transcription antitermination factor NusG
MLAKLADDSEFRALAMLAAAAASARQASNPCNAEIVPGVIPRWHILTTHPGQEAIAVGHLMDRRFGVYLPEYDRTETFRGCTRVRHLRMFPGYVFLFVWDVMLHWRRIRACTGVSTIMLDGGRPVVVRDGIVNDIQALECNLLLRGPCSPLKVIPRFKRKGWRKNPVVTQEVEEVVSLSTRSFLCSLSDVDGLGSNRLLHRALGLACSGPLVE